MTSLRITAFTILWATVFCDSRWCPDVLDVDTACTCSRQTVNATRTETWISCKDTDSVPDISTYLNWFRNKGISIEKFQLSNSRIGTLPSNLFQGVSVQEIQIWDTPLSSISQGSAPAFQGLEKSLERLSMRRCNLTDNVVINSTAHLEKLALLDLSENRLTKLPDKMVQINLQVFQMRRNNIEKVIPGALSGAFNLRQLDLSENNIEQFQRSMLPNSLTMFLNLQLSYNRIKNLPDDMFTQMPSLNRIYMSGNRLNSMPLKVWSTIWSNDGLHVDVIGNPFTCDKSFEWMAKSRGKPLDRMLYGYCSSPPQVAGVPLASLRCPDKGPCNFPCC